MKTRRLIALASSLLLASATTALAEAGTRQDNSQYLVWAFLGMCALIVIIQLMPVAILAFGMVKGLLKGKSQVAVQEVTSSERT